MAPVAARFRSSLGSDKISAHLGALKTQTYAESSRGSAGGAIRSISWNSLGTFVATTSGDKNVRVWNPERPGARFCTVLSGHTSPVEKVGFNPCKETELCSVDSEGNAKFWDVKTKAVINEVTGLGFALTLTWSPDGSTLLIGNKDDLIHVLSPTQSTTIVSHQQPVQTNQIAFCHSGKRVFLTTGDGRVKILSYPDFQPALLSKSSPKAPFTLNGHTSSCLSVELQQPARLLATGGSDSIIALWDTTDWICKHTLIEMTGPVRSISFSFDGSYIVGGSDEGTGLEIAHAESGEYIYSIKTTSPCPIVAWHPNRYILAYGEGSALKILGADTR